MCREFQSFYTIFGIWDTYTRERDSLTAAEFSEEYSCSVHIDLLASIRGFAINNIRKATVPHVRVPKITMITIISRKYYNAKNITVFNAKFILPSHLSIVFRPIAL